MGSRRVGVACAQRRSLEYGASPPVFRCIGMARARAARAMRPPAPTPAGLRVWQPVVAAHLVVAVSQLHSGGLRRDTYHPTSVSQHRAGLLIMHA